MTNMTKFRIDGEDVFFTLLVVSFESNLGRYFFIVHFLLIIFKTFQFLCESLPFETLKTKT